MGRHLRWIQPLPHHCHCRPSPVLQCPAGQQQLLPACLLHPLVAVAGAPAVSVGSCATRAPAPFALRWCPGTCLARSPHSRALSAPAATSPPHQKAPLLPLALQQHQKHQLPPLHPACLSSQAQPADRPEVAAPAAASGNLRCAWPVLPGGRCTASVPQCLPRPAAGCASERPRSAWLKGAGRCRAAACAAALHRLLLLPCYQLPWCCAACC